MYKDSTRLVLWVHHPVHSPTPPDPTTPKELLANIVAMRNTVPVIAFITIVRYHDRFPWLQTSQSFNAVLELAVRHSAVGTVRKLLHSMQACGKAFDERTVALVTRLRVRVSHRSLLRLRRRWMPQSTLGAHNRHIRGDGPAHHIASLFGETIEAELARVQSDTSLEVLSELLGTPHGVSRREYREAYLKAFRRDIKKVVTFERLLRKRRKRGQVFLPKLTVASVPPHSGSPISAIEGLSRDYEALAARPAKEFGSRIPPLSTELVSHLVAKIPSTRNRGAIHHIHLLLIRRFLLEGKREVGTQIATAYVQELCLRHTSLPHHVVIKVLSIVHLLLHAKYGCSSYAEGRNILVAMLQLHSDLKPQPRTLVILLQNLRTANRRSVRAYEALQWFRKRWPEIEDESVRRTVAKFALQGKSPRGEAIAREMAEREATFGTRWRMRVARGEDLAKPRARSFGKIYTREHRDKQEWIRMGLITRRAGFELASGAGSGKHYVGRIS
ncbi:hypothetical protein M408DRAFT_125477 [Serendipita vermifera MAFF 305830]|uniref:Uncharacterized protein n=1 Tax=Serendipita vermifera MAFF 305830 TaxID=933852 RepID=A0A0C3AWN1_SERVB|nr:hypothetical protein M408DRAFT_125477 [Serendipita vermifera MAFF 305830]